MTTQNIYQCSKFSKKAYMKGLQKNSTFTIFENKNKFLKTN